MFRQLSHVIDESQPNWPGAPDLKLIPCHAISNGDIANTHVITMYSHYGTHIDLPYHFFEDGERLGDFPLESFIFDNSVVIDCPLAENELLSVDLIREVAPVVQGHDLVLLKSGFESRRIDPILYATKGPGLSGAAAKAIREFWPDARAIGMDWLSVCAWEHVDEGVDAHRVLLGHLYGRPPVLIIEDMRLSNLAGYKPSRVLALPLFIAALDGAPCTVVAEMNE